MTANVGKTLKSLMHKRITTNGGDFATHTVFTDEDFAAAADQGINRRKCLDWLRYIYKYYKEADDRKNFLSMKELDEDAVQCIFFLLKTVLIIFYFFFENGINFILATGP